MSRAGRVVDHETRLAYPIFMAIMLVLLPTMVPASASAVQGTPEWQPAALPAGASGPVEVYLLAVDMSGSMRESAARAIRARAAARVQINECPDDCYVVLVAFGTGAEIVEARLITSQYNRDELCKEVEGIRMADQWTDIRALEALIREVDYALNLSYGSRGYTLNIAVLTDGRPDPVEKQDTRSFDLLLGEKTKRKDLGDGLLSYAVLFTSRAGSGPALPPAPPSATPLSSGTTRAGASVGSGAGRGLPAIHFPGGTVGLLVTGCVLVGIMAGLALLQRRSEARHEGMKIREHVKANSGDAAGKPVLAPQALRVTEWAVEPDGHKRMIYERASLPYVPDRPLTVGADGKRSTFCLRGHDAPAELVALVLDGKGGGLVEPLNRPIFWDGTKVTERTAFSARENHVVRAGTIEIHVEPARAQGDAQRRFRRLMAKRPSTVGQNEADGLQKHEKVGAA